MPVSLTLAPEPDGIPVARRLADEVDAGPAQLDAIRVVIDELASNAVHHARTPFTVTLHVDFAVVRIEVRDSSSDQPELQPIDPASARGRGLVIVDGVSEDWGVEPESDGGKTVWARVSVA